jgi:hypothetical protein
MFFLFLLAARIFDVKPVDRAEVIPAPAVVINDLRDKYLVINEIV